MAGPGASPRVTTRTRRMRKIVSAVCFLHNSQCLTLLTCIDEMLRLKRIKENVLLLGELGIHTSLQARASSSSQGPIATPPIRTKKQRVARPPVYDRSGYIISQPGPGQTFRMACVEMPSDRKVRKRISDGEYQDCLHWAEGEDRRWRLGDGEGSFEAGEEVLIGGVGPDFRWRKWRGPKNELRREMRLRGDLNEMDIRVTRSTAAEGVSDYSVSFDPWTRCPSHR